MLKSTMKTLFTGLNIKKKQCNYDVQQIRKAEAGDWKGKFANAGNSINFWKIVRAMQRQKKNHKIGPTENDPRMISFDNKQKAERFKSVFCNN